MTEGEHDEDLDLGFDELDDDGEHEPVEDEPQDDNVEETIASVEPLFGVGGPLELEPDPLADAALDDWLGSSEPVPGAEELAELDRRLRSWLAGG